MNRRLIIAISAIVLLLVLATGVGAWIYLAHRSSQSQAPQKRATLTGQWVHSGPGQPTPTPPAGGYLFKDPTGGYVVYFPPSIVPTNIAWTTFDDTQGGYSINYPSTWVRVDGSSDGFSGLALYPPGTKLDENVPGGPEGIGFGWSQTAQLSPPTDPTVTDTTAIMVDGVAGHLYTQGSLGAAIIATFTHNGGTFVITVDAASDVLIYAFQHMLSSLKFSQGG
jgi:hypothetical protein